MDIQQIKALRDRALHMEKPRRSPTGQVILDDSHKNVLNQCKTYFKTSYDDPDFHDEFVTMSQKTPALALSACGQVLGGRIKKKPQKKRSLSPRWRRKKGGVVKREAYVPTQVKSRGPLPPINVPDHFQPLRSPVKKGLRKSPRRSRSPFEYLRMRRSR